VIPWSPLARGRLARPWQSESTMRSETDAFGNRMYAKTEEADRAVVDRLTELAKQRGVAQPTLALAWMLAKPGVTGPIVGASKAHHLEDAVAALGVRLTNDEVARLEEAYVPHPVLGFS
jgi:aryl-alcohol dehydrogenase-like predicted oxidoreductase